jgi:hypothetical protein
MALLERAYLISYNKDYKYRGKIANVIAVKKTPHPNPRLVYVIAFEDGATDIVFFDNIENNDWHFVTIEELLSVGMPK